MPLHGYPSILDGNCPLLGLPQFCSKNAPPWSLMEIEGGLELDGFAPFWDSLNFGWKLLGSRWGES